MDFAFSYIVFQHIPSLDVIKHYVREAGRALRPGALFKFQVQGAEIDSGEGPDTWLGASVSRLAAAELAQEGGFELRHSIGEGTQDYWLWMFRRGR